MADATLNLKIPMELLSRLGKYCEENNLDVDEFVMGIIEKELNVDRLLEDQRDRIKASLMDLSEREKRKKKNEK